MESILRFDGKVTFITGSTRGIGWSTARTFAKQGATVLLNGVSNEDILDARVDEIKKEFGVKCEGFLFDVSDPDSVQMCYSAIFKKYKQLDILVNNAGIMDDRLLAMVTPENIDRTFNVNVKAMIYSMQYASRLMARRKSGSIINVASIIGRVGNAGQVVYGGSKAAVIGLTLSAAKELAAQNIRVNAVAPGFIDTDMVKSMAVEKFEERVDSIKMSRIGSPEDVARAILFFASDLSTYITGQILGVDGGMLI
jgi:3-oxoacyl-[acyl-carrier protein] reductase